MSSEGGGVPSSAPRPAMLLWPTSTKTESGGSSAPAGVAPDGTVPTGRHWSGARPRQPDEPHGQGVDDRWLERAVRRLAMADAPPFVARCYEYPRRAHPS